MRPRLSDDTRHALAAHATIQWANVREAALRAFDDGESYRYHDGAVTHDCTTLDALARVTRRERKRDGVRWAEDR